MFDDLQIPQLMQRPNISNSAFWKRKKRMQRLQKKIGLQRTWVSNSNPYCSKYGRVFYKFYQTYLSLNENNSSPRKFTNIPPNGEVRKIIIFKCAKNQGYMLISWRFFLPNKNFQTNFLPRCRGGTSRTTVLESIHRLQEGAPLVVR